jgi:hypothetical protein
MLGLCAWMMQNKNPTRLISLIYKIFPTRRCHIVSKNKVGHSARDDKIYVCGCFNFLDDLDCPNVKIEICIGTLTYVII